MVEKDASARLRRAVKENNLFLVKRLIQRTDMRNPDPDAQRYTSLAWAAVLGHEETFEFLLSEGHDEVGLSKDSENNTILTLLAEVQPGVIIPHTNPDLMGAVLRMARLYHDRYPYMLDFANLQGKTPLHAAALKGNEEMATMFCDLGADLDLSDNLGNTPLHYASAWGHVPVVQLLIERGCNYTCPNNDGFTASDYAYTFSTRDTLQKTARDQFDSFKNNKKARRNAQAGARGVRTNDWAASTSDSFYMPPLKVRDFNNSAARMRSGSGGSRTTATSDSGELDAILVGQSPSASSQSQPSAHSSSGSFTRILSSNSSQQPTSSTSTTSTFSLPSPGPITTSTSSTVSPIVNRMRERDAGAIAEYMKRNRSGSSTTTTSSSTTEGKSSASSPVIPPVPPLNGHNVLSSVVSPLSMGASFAQRRRLRPSVSAAQLRSSPPPSIVTTNAEGVVAHRSRSGTNPTPQIAPESPSLSPTRSSSSSSHPYQNGMSSASRPSTRRVGTGPSPNRLDEDDDEEDNGNYTGPPSEYAIFPPPPASVDSDTSATPTSRRIPFNLLKPLPSIDPLMARGHRRGISATALRGG